MRRPGGQATRACAAAAQTRPQQAAGLSPPSGHRRPCASAMTGPDQAPDAQPAIGGVARPPARAACGAQGLPGLVVSRMTADMRRGGDRAALHTQHQTCACIEGSLPACLRAESMAARVAGDIAPLRPAQRRPTARTWRTNHQDAGACHVTTPPAPLTNPARGGKAAGRHAILSPGRHGDTHALRPADGSSQRRRCQGVGRPRAGLAGAATPAGT